MGWDYGYMLANEIEEVYNYLVHSLLPSPLEQPIVEIVEKGLDWQVRHHHIPSSKYTVKCIAWLSGMITFRSSFPSSTRMSSRESPFVFLSIST